jgi:phosphate starvation-inducible PhoH-like protein
VNGVRQERSLEFDDYQLTRDLFGPQGGNLAYLSEKTGVDIESRGGKVNLVSDDKQKLDLAANVLVQLYGNLKAGRSVSMAEVEAALSILSPEPASPSGGGDAGEAFAVSRKKSVGPKSPGQREYIRAMLWNDLVFGIGPAGTGKTYLAVAMAAGLLLKKEVKRLILTRPAVEAGEKLGFLPGDMVEKVNPYLRPLYDALHDMLEFRKVQEMIETGVIEIAPLAFMRGRTLNDSFVILDEAQNTTREQMKMFLTRLGFGSRAVVTGDITQIDLPEGSTSGLIHAGNILSGVEGIGIVRFKDEDVIRHPLVARIVQAYERERQASK